MLNSHAVGQFLAACYFGFSTIRYLILKIQSGRTQVISGQPTMVFNGQIIDQLKIVQVIPKMFEENIPDQQFSFFYDNTGY